TTTDVAEYVEDFGSGLDHVFAKYASDTQGAAAGQQPLGILSINRAEWLLAEFSACRSRRYTVGINDGAGVTCAEHMINHADVSVIVCSLDKIPRMFDRIAQTPGLRVVISMDRLDCSRVSSVIQAFCAETADIALRKRAKDLGIILLDMDEVLEMGRATPTTAQPPTPDNIYTICYTSGTTSSQKGVVISHRGFIHAVRGTYLTLHYTDATYMSYASLSHSMDRYAIHMLMYGGVRIGFFAGDFTRIVEDMQELRPTIIFAFPMLLNAIYKRVAKATIGAGGIKGMLSRFAYRSKQKRIASTGNLKHALWDRVLFGKVAAALGGRFNVVVSGAMALNPDVMDFFRIALSCEILQGYGQTETMASGTAQRLGDFDSGHIGVPCPGIDIRLRNQPELGYLASDLPSPRGELMMRSKSVFVEYLKEPEKTRKAMDGEWLATGDIVQINPSGTISIISRINNYFQISVGMWIMPERLENIYSQNPLVQMLFIHGNQRCSKVVAIVVPEPSTFLPWARSIAKLPEASLEKLCAHATVVQELMRDLLLRTNSAGLPTYEQLGAIFIEPTPFLEKGCGLYTSTLKLKRGAVAKHYEEQLNKLYAEVGECERPSLP
ncbi:medium-chain fatty acid-CoA ligase faa2, partial [Coemansia sp. RSA 1836]